MSLNAALVFPPQDVHLHRRLQNMIAAPVLQKLERCRYQMKDGINIDFTKSRQGEGCHYVVQSALTAPPGRPDAGGGFKTSQLLRRSNQSFDFKHGKKLACVPIRNTSECSCGVPQYWCRAGSSSAAAPR